MLVAGNFKTGRNELKIGLVGDEISKKKRTGAIFAILSISTILAMLLTRVPGWCRGPRMRGFGSPKHGNRGSHAPCLGTGARRTVATLTGGRGMFLVSS